MQPKTITFAGKETVVPFIGGRQLTRIAAALRELMQQAGLANDESITALQAGQYPLLILSALDHVMAHLSEDLALTKAERLFYGTVGEFVGLDADAMADAPLDDLVALCQAIFTQEAETQAGKSLIRSLASFGSGLGGSTGSESKPGSTTDTTPSPGKTTKRSTGTRKAG